MKIFEQGSAKPIDLGQKDYRARGGQGAIYVRGDKAYKIFGTFIENPPRSGNLVFQEKPEWALPLGRIKELSTIKTPEAIKPELPILDAAGIILGHTMKAVTAKYVLTAIMPRVFRERPEGQSPEDSLRIAQTIQRGIKACHGQGFKLCDIQPNNFLITEDFREISFIDVDSWGTPHYPPLALIESARDWVLCPTDPPTITEETDWWSFAVLAFEIFVGIHPFKGRHPRFPKVAIRQRMEARMSVLNREVRVDPDCIMPLTSIPSAYRAWFESTFEQGRRLPPPEGPVDAIKVVAGPQAVRIQGKVKARLLRSLAGNLFVLLPGEIDVTSTAVYRRGHKISDAQAHAHYAVTPRAQAPVQCWLGDYSPSTGMRAVLIRDLLTNSMIASCYEAHDIIGLNGRVLLRVADQLLALTWFESGTGAIRAAADVVAQVSQNTTKLFPGLAIQSLLGATYATLLPNGGGAYEVRLRELEGKSILDARLEGSVLQVATEDKGKQGVWTYRFSRDFSTHDANAEDVTATGHQGLNFAALDTGVCVESRDGELRMFAKRPGQTERTVIRDSGLPGNMKLFADGARLLGAVGGELFHLTMV